MNQQQRGVPDRDRRRDSTDAPPAPREPIISVSGLRGIVGESLSPELVLRFACAFAAESPAGPIVVGRDGRSTGPMLVEAVTSGLRAVGRDVIDADVAATPTLGVLVTSRKAAGGVQVTASHNPPEYNGLKLFGADGRVLTDRAGQAVLRRFRDGDVAWVPHDRVGQRTTCDDGFAEHLRRVTSIVDVDRIRRRRFRVLVDSNHGAGGAPARRLLEQLGCDVTVLGEEPDGAFEHPAEPTAENLSGVLATVASSGADVGFCQDPDADRLALIDHSGRYVGEEYTLALCVDHVLRRRVGTIVTNCSSSRMSADIARGYGAQCRLSAVGEANVVERMQETDAVFGGEGNGGPIDPRVGYVRDSFVGMALILDGLAQRDESLADWVERLPRYSIHKSKVPVHRDRIGDALFALRQAFDDARPDDRDGLRLDWPDRWLLVRASNTEPIVRAVAEADSAEQAASLCRRAEELLAPFGC